MAERGTYIKSLAPGFIFYLFLAFQPVSTWLSPLRAFGVCSAISTVCCFTMREVMTSRDIIGTPLMAVAVNLNMIFRTLVHVFALWAGGDSTLLHLFTIVVLPLSSARETRSVMAFKVYLAVHFVLVLLRFRNDYNEGLPFLLLLPIMDSLLLDIANQRHIQRETRMKLQESTRTARYVSKEVTLSLLSKLSDAVVTLGEDLRISDNNSLHAMLGMRAQNLEGRAFPDLIECSDRAEFLATARASSSGTEDVGQIHASTVKVQLVDAYALPVAVYLFHVRLHGVHIVGISEAWKPPAERRTTRRSGRSKPPAESKQAKDATKYGTEPGGTASRDDLPPLSPDGLARQTSPSREDSGRSSSPPPPMGRRHSGGGADGPLAQKMLHLRARAEQGFASSSPVTVPRSPSPSGEKVNSLETTFTTVKESGQASQGSDSLSPRCAKDSSPSPPSMVKRRLKNVCFESGPSLSDSRASPGLG